MSKYEYKTRSILSLELEERLNYFSIQGWELVSHALSYPTATMVHCIFRKRIPRKKEVANEQDL